MGSGLIKTCSKCNKRYRIYWECGFRFVEVNENEKKAIREGEYGEEWQNLALKEKYVVTDPDYYVFFCDKCGDWMNELDHSLYVPKNPEALKIKYHLDSLDELEERDMIMAEDIKREYKLLKKWIHKCDRCGAEMRKINLKDKECDLLRCPECDGEPIKEDFPSYINWD